MFIEFSFNRKLLFILIFPIFRELQKIILQLFIQKDDFESVNRKLFRIFKVFLSNEFSFIFLLIFKCMNKSSKKENNIDDQNKIVELNEHNDENRLVDIELKKVTKKKRIKSILFLVLLSSIYFGSYSFNYFVGRRNMKYVRNSIGIIYEIIIFYILSSTILKEKYYKHHLISSIIICLTLIPLFIIYFQKLDNDEYSIYNAFWYYLIYYILYGSFNILLKKYFIVYFHSIYFILAIIGAIIFIPMLICDFILYFVDENSSFIIMSFINGINTIKYVFLFIVELIFFFISTLGIFWTIYYFTPFHLIICEFISELLDYYIRLIGIKINKYDKTNNYGFLYENINVIIFSVVFFINLICSLIFNEIIIFKLCNLEYYTKKYIKDRAKIDVSSLFMKDDLIDNENELTDIKDN